MTAPSGLDTTTARQLADQRLKEHVEAQCDDYMRRASAGGFDFETWVTINQVRNWLNGWSRTRPPVCYSAQREIAALRAENGALVDALEAERVAYVAVVGLAEANRRAAIEAETGQR